MTTIEDFWKRFKRSYPTYANEAQPATFYFCDNQTDADECARLTAAGTKQATSTSLWWFEKNGEPLPEPGSLYIITNWQGNPVAIVKTVAVSLVKFKDITANYAAIEGEGDLSLNYWKEVHWTYYAREMQTSGQQPDQDMLIVCEQFKTIFT